MAPEVQQLVLVPEVRVAPDERLAPSPVAVVEHAFVAVILIYRVSVAVTHEKTVILPFFILPIQSLLIIESTIARRLRSKLSFFTIACVQRFVQIAFFECNKQIRIKII